MNKFLVSMVGIALTGVLSAYIVMSYFDYKLAQARQPVAEKPLEVATPAPVWSGKSYDPETGATCYTLLTSISCVRN